MGRVGESFRILSHTVMILLVGKLGFIKGTDVEREVPCG